MDWKEILRRRLATPSTSPNSEFGRSRPLREPGPRDLGGDDGWGGTAPLVKPLLTKEAAWDVVERSRGV